jgi:hypothetical protein
MLGFPPLPLGRYPKRTSEQSASPTLGALLGTAPYLVLCPTWHGERGVTLKILWRK